MSIRKFGAVAALLVASLGFTSFSANAVLITQSLDLLDDQGDAIFSFGEITIDFNESEIGTGLVSVFDLVSLKLEGSEVINVDDFEAIIDATSASSVYAGIEFLIFDVDAFNGDAWNFLYDEANPGDDFLDVFDSNDDLVFFLSAGEFGLGEARVPAPAGIAILTLGLFAMGLRRRKN